MHPPPTPPKQHQKTPIRLRLSIIAFFTALSTEKSLWQISSAQIKLKMQYTTKTGNSYLSKENKHIKQEGTVVLQ